MKMSFDMTIEQTQKPVMTPELLQAIKILQFNTQELEQFVNEQLLTNPVLERNEEQEKEIDWREHFRAQKYDGIGYRYNNIADNDNDDDSFYEQHPSYDISLSEHLRMQLDFLDLSKTCKEVVAYIIEALDDNGYLRVPLIEIAKLFNLTDKQVRAALAIVQGFEPTGVGARNLSECLLLQLMEQPGYNDKIVEIVTTYLEEIADNRLNIISRETGISLNCVQKISDLIKRCNPKPGQKYDNKSQNRYIIPDVTVDIIDSEYIIMVSDTTAPRLMINSYYKNLLLEIEEESVTSKFLTDRLNRAAWLLRSIEQRRKTIYSVVESVINNQREFFEKGTLHMKPLTLREVAEEIGVHESTVSRSINGKYMQTPRGMFEIKYFFNSGVSANDGRMMASESIKTVIKQLIDKEDKKVPYSDQNLCDQLNNRGINISRRTVAKYRDELEIPSSSKRRRFY